MGDAILLFLQAFGTTVLLQLGILFCVFFIFGMVLSKLQTWTHRLYQRHIGWKGILFTAWIGTPIHEIGHALFAAFFHHKITHISFFKPNRETGGLGHVDHAYNPKSMYQSVGNFFIGAAPMIFGSFVLAMLLIFLVPNGRDSITPLSEQHKTIAAFVYSVQETIKHIFMPQHLRTWQFWLFLYLSFCVVSHIAPSKQDRKGMWRGFIWVIVLLVLVNGIGMLVRRDVTPYILTVQQYLGVFTGLFTYAFVIALVHFIAATILLAPFKRR